MTFEWGSRGRRRIAAVMAVLAMAGAGATLLALFTNGGFESGDFTGWSKTHHQRGPLQGGAAKAPDYTRDDVVLTAGGSDASAVVGNGTGPLVFTDALTTGGTSTGPGLQFPRYGNYAARVGNYSSGAYNANVLTQRTVITSDAVDSVDGKAHVSFAYAVAMFNPAHQPHQQPYFFVTLRNVTRNRVLYERFAYAGMPGLSWYTGSSSSVSYTSWNVIDLAPGSGSLQVGDEVEIEVIATECSQGAVNHSAWVYLDAFGSTIPGPSVTVSAPAYVRAGTQMTYDYVVRNGANAAFTNTVVELELPAGTTHVSNGHGCGVSGQTLTCTLGTLAAESSQTIGVVVAVDNAATGTLTTGPYTIAADASPAVFGPSASTQVTVDQPVDLRAALSATPSSIYPGAAGTYELTVHNGSSTPVPGAIATVTLPAPLTASGWTCAPAAGSTCGASSGSGALHDAATIGAGSSVTYTLTASLGSATAGVTLSVLGGVTAPVGYVDTDSTNDSDLADQTVVTDLTDLTAAIAHTSGTPYPGAPVTYTVTFANTGLSASPGTSVTSSFPILQGTSWTCAGSGGAACATGGTGAPSGLVSLPAGSSVTFVVTGIVDPTASVGVPLTAAAGVTPPLSVDDTNLSNNTASDAQTVAAWPTDLGTQVSRIGAEPSPGGPLAYRIVASNHATYAVTGAALAVSPPSALQSATWTCAAAGGSTCPAASGVGVPGGPLSLAAGGSLTFDVQGTVAPVTAVGSPLSMTTGIAPPVGHLDPVPSNDTAQDTTIVTAWQVDIQTTITSSAAAVRAGESVEYVITVRNASARAVPDVHVTLPGGVPPELADVSWSCTALGAGSSCVNPATSTLNEHVALGPYSLVRYTLTGVVAPLVTPGQVFAVTAAASLPPSGAYTDSAPANNTASVSRRVASSRLTGLTPTAGLASGGTLVEIIGSGFLGVSGLEVTMGGVRAPIVEVVDDTRLRVVAPPLPAGTRVDVVVAATGPAAESFTLTQAYLPMDLPTTSVDTDEDGMPDEWELRFGLDPLMPDAGADPDGDGLTNSVEHRLGRHPRGFHTRYYAEGAESEEFFSTHLALLNHDSIRHGHVLVRFQREAGLSQSVAYLDMPPSVRRTVQARDVLDVAGAAAALVESDVPIVSTRTMRWGAEGQHYGSHAEGSIERPALTWYIAEGATHSGFALYYLIHNSTDSDAEYEVDYLLGDGTSFTRSYRAARTSRSNILVNEVPGIAGHAHGEVSAVVRSTNGVPLIVERSMYQTNGGRLFESGHTTAAVTDLSTHWYFAEGATTDDYFHTFLLVGNPQEAPVTLTVTYYLPDGSRQERTHVVAPKSRYTIWVNRAEGPELASTSFATRIVASAPVVAERAMWWSGQDRSWQEAHSSVGAVAPAMRWGVADAEVGGSLAAETYLLIGNVHDTLEAEVTLTLCFEDGTATRTVPVRVGAASRTSLAMSTLVDAAGGAGRRFSVVVESTNGTPVVVETSVYTDGSDGTRWAAGSNTLASPLTVH